ncbi:MAG: bifunctional folylpolyglutamate synthase/dihydrofolate synthase, partial [Chitinophagaceae bacterium]
RIQPQIEKLEPSFFEITVAMAFDAFAKDNVDIAIIEVGLGGRLDSTNIITPELSIITNIGWDHMNLLGNSLIEIAAEKAGIIKENVPVVIGETLPETKAVFAEKANAGHSPIYFAEEAFGVIGHSINTHSLSVRYTTKEKKIVSIETDLPGIYQVHNIRTALTSINILRQLNWKLDETNVMYALQNVKDLTGLMGRWEVLREKPAVILEVAHNKEGMTKMLQHLEQLSFSKLHLVLGMVKDKDVNQVLELLPKQANYYFTQAHIPRALAAEELAKKAGAVGINGTVYEDVNSALGKAVQQASANDMIVVCGSIFLVAEVDRKIFAN